MKKYKVKMKYDFASALLIIINEVLTSQPESEEDMLFLAALAEVKSKLCSKMIEWQKEYKLSLSPAQALSIRLVYVRLYDASSTSFVINRLHQIANEIHQYYS